MSAPGLNFLDMDAFKFSAIWDDFDKDKNGYIEESELDDFMKFLVTEHQQQEPTEQELKDWKTNLLSFYDLNKDGKISMQELAEILLPKEQSFLHSFRKSVPALPSVKFMEIWRKYDADCSGYLATSEVKNFVIDFLIQSGVELSPHAISDHTANLMDFYDRDKDGLLDLKDMAQLLNVSDNFLLQFVLEEGTKSEKTEDFEKIFKAYDVDETGALEGFEIDGLVKDLMERIGTPITANQLDEFKKNIMAHSDTNADGKIQKNELAVFLGMHTK